LNNLRVIFRKILHILFALLLISTPSISQHKTFINYGANDGLPSPTIYSIKQDKRGIIWLGTENGLCTFDGTKFTNAVFQNSIAGKAVRCIKEDRKGNLWFGTNGGITMFDGNNYKHITKNDGLNGKTILCFLEDELGNIWAGSDDGGVNVINLKNGKYSIKNISINSELGNVPVFDFFEDVDKNIWFLTLGGGICICETKNNNKLIFIKAPQIPTDYLLTLHQNKGNLIVGTANAGAFEINIKSKKVLKTYNLENELNSNYIFDVLVAKNGTKWFGSADNGLTKLRLNNEISTYTNIEGLAGNIITCLFEDRESNIWVGTSTNGLSIVNTESFDHFNKEDGFKENAVQSIKQDAKGNLWLTTSGGGISKIESPNKKQIITNYDSKYGFPDNYPSCLALGNKNNNNIWIGTNSNGLIKFDGKWSTVFTENDGLLSNKVYSVFVDSKGMVWCGTANGINLYDGLRFQQLSTDFLKMKDGGVNSIIEDKNGNIWFGTSGGLVRYNKRKQIRTFDEVEGLMDVNINAIALDDANNIWIATNHGKLYKFDFSKPDSNSISLIANLNNGEVNTLKSIVIEKKNQFYFGTNKGFLSLKLNNDDKILSYKIFDSSDGFIGEQCSVGAICRDNHNNIWFGTYNGLTKYKPIVTENKKVKPLLNITSVQLFYKDVDWLTKADSLTKWFGLPVNLSLSYEENQLSFNFKGISFKNPKKIKYSYILVGQDKVWSPLSNSSFVNFSGIAPGNYTFKVVAIDANGEKSNTSAFSFVILPPWYQTKMFYGLVILFITISFYVFVKVREKKLKEDKHRLEQTVEERTLEVVQQKLKVEHKNKEITESITYAKGLQDATLPPLHLIKKHLPESFILYKPKDIVAGDFYWFENANLGGENVILMAAADCTGHGVPGAMVSMVCSNALNRVVNEFGTTTPGLILDKVREIVIETFIKSEKERKDGMDVSLFALNITTLSLEWSGANNPLWIIRKGTKTIEEIKANKQPIGNTEIKTNFTTHQINLLNGDAIYIFTDGYQDQFGGEKGKKFMVSKLKELFISVAEKSMQEQNQIIDTTFEHWRGSNEQVDDVCVIGVRV
jgi:ligand-binding sensor domain-containing protein/serine phosphatase RsbU (regulator of sigma subunit)